MICATFVAGCDLPGKPNPDDRPQPPNQVTSFDILFRQNCSACHGADGKLGPAPPLNDPLFLAIVSRQELVNVISSGRRGTPMPAFAKSAGGSLTDQQVSVLAEGIPSHWKSATPLQGNLPEYLLSKADEPPAPAGDPKQREALFERACAECHGKDGQGDGAGAINDPDFLALISDQALRRIIITGRPDLGMPNYAESDSRPDDFEPLTSAEIDELVALLAAWRIGGKVASKDNP